MTDTAPEVRNERATETAALSDAAPSEIDISAFKVLARRARSLITRGVKAGLPWDAATTVGDVARASRMSPERVVRLIRGCGYWMHVDELPGKAIEEWGVWEDGE